MVLIGVKISDIQTIILRDFDDDDINFPSSSIFYLKVNSLIHLLMILLIYL